MVYWTEEINGSAVPQARAFPMAEMAAAMHFMEQLRIRKRHGEAIHFITMCSENPDAVGEAGVADPAADYSWKKRRR